MNCVSLLAWKHLGFSWKTSPGTGEYAVSLLSLLPPTGKGKDKTIISIDVLLKVRNPHVWQI